MCTSGLERVFRDMGVELRGEPAGRRLNTWKEIATFFGRDERTVRRWETSRHLPVRRLPNGPRSSVFAYEGELRAWLDRTGGHEETAGPTPENTAATPKRTQLFLALAAILAMAGLVLVVLAAARFEGLYPLTPKPAARGVHVPNAEARNFYAAGLYAWQTRTPVGLTHALDDFTQAIVHDPEYADAYAGLATCYDLLREYTTMAPDYAFARAKSAAERAIALDPDLASAHAALAFADFYWLRDRAAARREFATALALAPANATAHHWYATFFLTIGAFPQALSQIERAEALDSESTAIRADKGIILYHAGHTGEAVGLLRQLEQTEPLFASTHHYLAVIYRTGGNDSGYLRELAASASSRDDEADKAIAAAGAAGLGEGGHSGMLHAMLAAERKLFAADKLTAYALAETYAQLGDAKDALDYLRTSLDRRETESPALAIDPAFAALRADSAFRALVAMAAAPATLRKGQ